MERAELKKAIVDYLAQTLGDALTPQIVEKTLKAVKDSVNKDLEDWAIENFRKASVQSKMMSFAHEYRLILQAEYLAAQEAIQQAMEDFEGMFGEDALDSSGLPELSGSYKQAGWAFTLRSAAFHRCSTVERVQVMREEILHHRDAKYWIENYK